MTELDELEIGIGRLKKNSNEQRRFIEELKKEREFLARKNNTIEESIRKMQEQIKPSRTEINELRKELEGLSSLINEIQRKESKFESMLTEQKSNLFLLRSRFEKDIDKVLAEIDDRIKENKKIELSTFSEVKSRIDRLAGLEERVRDDSKAQKMAMDKLAEEVSKLQQTVAGLVSKSFGAELENLDKRISSETKSMNKQISEGAQVMAALRDRLHYFDPVLRELSEKLESQTKLLNRILESKDFLLKRSESFSTELKSLKERLSDEKERIEILEKEREDSRKGVEDTRKQLQSAFQQAIQGRSKEIEAEISGRYKNLEVELKSLTKELSLKKDRMAALEEDIKNQADGHESKLGVLGDSINRIQLSEAKRGENFNNMVERLQELQIRTEDSLKSLNEKIGQISRIESNLEKKLQKENEAIFKRIGSSHDKLDERVTESENYISGLNESIKGLGKRLEEQFMLITDAGKRMSSMEHALGEQSRTQESHLKNIENVVKIIDDIEDRISGSEKILSQIDGLAERITGLEEDSKRIEGLDRKTLGYESTISQITDSVKSLESRFQKSMQTDRLKERVSLLEQELKNRAREQKQRGKDFENLAKELEGIDGRVSDSEKVISHISKAVTDMRTRLMDDDALTKKFEEHSKTLDKVTNAGNRLTRLEERLKIQERDQDLRFNELIAVIKEIETGEAKRVEEFSSFANRFQNLKMKTEENLKTFNQNLKTLSRIKEDIKSDVMRENKLSLKDFGLDFDDVKGRVSASEGLIIQLNDMLNELRVGMGGLAVSTKAMDERMRMQESSSQSVLTDARKLISETESAKAKVMEENKRLFDRFQKTRAKTDESIKSMRSEINQLKRMKSELSGKEVSADERLNAFRKEIENRIKMNENMYDSEMDEFKKRLDNMIREMIAFKEMQNEFYGMVKETAREDAGAERVTGQAEVREPRIFKDIVPGLPDEPEESKIQKTLGRTYKKQTKPSDVLDELEQ